MRPEAFLDTAPGELARSLDRQWTFLPHPLPPQLRLDQSTIQRISEADIALGRLDGLGQMLPNPHLLIRPFLRREAVLSSRIEGTITGLEQLLMFEEAGTTDDRDDAAEVLNYVKALAYGYE